MKRKKMHARHDRWYQMEAMPWNWAKWFKRKHRPARAALKNKGIR